MKTYALQLCGPIDELLIGVFDTEEKLRQFAASNPPTGDSWRLREAAAVRGFDPLKKPFGYVATELVDGVPHRTKTFYWEEDGEEFFPFVPLFPEPEDDVPGPVFTHDGDHTGCGPVG